ncbi:hypothetical protein ACIBCA_27365 [Kitasatospora sp. NPDC051170]|uniref:hypothetical protein n=1 Tax=Kitasatospora sp. NPDC051170 TaxID=3364056 RepID=UPI0037966E1B
MTITTHSTPAAFAWSFLTGGVVGGSLAALVVGSVVDRPPLFVAGLVVPVVYGVLVRLAGAPGRAREAAVVPCTALAVIEELAADRDERSDASVRFELSVVPDDGPAHRVAVKQDINLVDLPRYQPRGVVVVQYPPDRPWRAKIVKRPTPEWEERAASARLDSVPGPATVVAPPEGCAFGIVGLLGLLLGAAAVVLFFRTELFDRVDDAAKPSVSVSATSSTTVVSSASGTVALGPGQSFLQQGELERALGSITQRGFTGQALTVVVQERQLSVVFSPPGTQAPGFDPRTLPFDRFPALVEEATTGLGGRSPQSWQITVERLTGSLVIRVVVTGAEGMATLEADGRGRVTSRAPAR